MTFFHTYDGVELEITAENFDGDDSIGLAFGPEEVSARRLDDNTDYPLTDDQIYELSMMAVEIYYDPPDFEDDWRPSCT